MSLSSLVSESRERPAETIDDTLPLTSNGSSPGAVVGIRRRVSWGHVEVGLHWACWIKCGGKLRTGPSSLTRILQAAQFAHEATSTFRGDNTSARNEKHA